MNYGKINIEEVKKMFHIDFKNDGRDVPLLPTFDNEGKIHLWVPQGDKLLDMSVNDLIEGVFFAPKKIKGDDIYLYFVDTLYQRISFVEIYHHFNCLINDLLNLGACIAKLELYFNHRREMDVRRLVITEVEYISFVCRSIFDLLQMMIKTIWHKIHLKDKNIKKQELADSFAKMCLKGNDIVVQKELISKYGLPEPLGNYYIQEAEFFKSLRDFRTKVIHKGHTVEFIFITDEGFSVFPSEEPFNTFGIWDEKTFISKGKLAPLNPIIGHMIQKTLNSIDEFFHVLEEAIELPEHFSKSHKVYLREHTSNKLKEVDLLLKSKIWYS